MAKYQVGDVVVVQEDLTPDEDYGYCFAVAEMVAFAGKEVTISSVDGSYLILEDNGDWSWTDEMFSGLSTIEPDFELGDMSLEQLLGVTKEKFDNRAIRPPEENSSGGFFMPSFF